ncbi:SGNH/GDSL hydrolase family protein [Rufibacter psychrotolerans]|uniref:SGNH/GDSL hydrolase family protein n=1 Tax=Rufibacter psychrotolerans TaxID=2812556 RepID=UPI00196860C0|nr:SGNH/GDSL hydrolase family protein [Rufibacter sp. SYSU D00308]
MVRGLSLFFWFLWLCPLLTVGQRVVLNKGIGGNNTHDLLRRLQKDVLAEKPDLVILMVGTNDMLNSQKLVPYAQFQENYQAILGQLKAQNIRVMVMAPPPVDTGYVLSRHDRRAFTEDLNAKLDSAGGIVRALAAEHRLPFLDLNERFKAWGSPSREAHSLIINQANMGKEDGIHPTKEGYARIGQEVYRYLKKKRLLKKNQKIVCFGDSMTYGSYMDGAGTAHGDTYPAVLQRLLQKKN